MRAVNAMGHALVIAGSMTWEVLWALVLGFTLSAVVQAVVRRQTIARLLGDDRPKTLVIAGAAAAWIPDTLWRAFFLQDHPILARIWGPIPRSC